MSQNCFTRNAAWRLSRHCFTLNIPRTGPTGSVPTYSTSDLRLRITRRQELNILPRQPKEFPHVMEPILHTRQHAPQPSTVRSSCFIVYTSTLKRKPTYTLSAAGAMLNADIPVAIQYSPLAAGRYARRGKGLVREAGKWGRYVPVTAKKGLFFPF